MALPISHPVPPEVFEPKRWQRPLVGYYMNTSGKMALLMQVNAIAWFYSVSLGGVCIAVVVLAVLSEILKRIARSAGERYMLCVQAILSYTDAHTMFHLLEQTYEALESVRKGLVDYNDRVSVLNEAFARINDVTGDPDAREAAADLIRNDEEMVNASPEQFEAALKEFLRERPS